MRIKINFTKNMVDVPINNQSYLNSYIHKCLGINNPYHDTPSNYNISHLRGGKINADNETISFKEDGDAYFVVSSKDASFIGKLISGIISNPEFCFGMKFKHLEHVNEYLTSGWNHFFVLSPILITNKKDKQTPKEEYKKTFFTVNGEYGRNEDGTWGIVYNPKYDFQEILKKHLLNKLSKIDNKLNLTDFDVKISFHEKHKVKRVLVKKNWNYVSQCQVSIHSNKKVIELLYNIGIGQSTGSGFGAVCLTGNIDLYVKGHKKLESKKTELVSELV